jgi:hypothetical protein
MVLCRVFGGDSVGRGVCHASLCVLSVRASLWGASLREFVSWARYESEPKGLLQHPASSHALGSLNNYPQKLSPPDERGLTL